ncbi:M81 family metallopeptidase [Sphingomonas sp. So64.6b]|uniref:M81 family metallopeptidase n=1 Tax=Sphingomonas sp. So64.6b TaxID=2997354 RepID=UPI00160103C0|nr:M81 family metallopeptidase [Sphingomonas sp. So64.6b]QNA85515.1 M81 family metallopeptidase [Sphingomonas sp. So64.6b]
MRVFTASLGTETNSFSPLPTGIQAFRDMFLWHAGEHPDDGPQITTAPLWVARQRARSHGWQVSEGLCAYATPAGPVTRPVYEALRDELLDDLKRALPVDAVLLGLHGAMIAEGYEDAEADLLKRLRAITGPTVVVGAAIDLHANLSEAMVALTDVIIAYKEYPHVDFVARAEELADIVAATVAGRIRPVQALADCAMITPLFTTQPEVAAFVERLRAVERSPAVLSVSFNHGFPFSDSPDMGARMLVVTDGDAALAQRLADALALEAFALRGSASRQRSTIAEALAALPPGGYKPVIWADIADNSGAGAPNDSTFILRALLDAKVADVALGPIWDPVAAAIAFDAGLGARLNLRVGGKIGPVSGDPLDLTVEVVALHRSMTQHYGQSVVPLGDCAAIRANGIDIVLSSTRIQAYHPELFTQLNVDLASKRLIVVKSGQHFHAAFAPLASTIVYVSAPGTLVPVQSLPFMRAARPKWPFDPPEVCRPVG